MTDVSWMILTISIIAMIVTNLITARHTYDLGLSHAKDSSYNEEDWYNAPSQIRRLNDKISSLERMLDTFTLSEAKLSKRVEELELENNKLIVKKEEEEEREAFFTTEAYLPKPGQAIFYEKHMRIVDRIEHPYVEQLEDKKFFLHKGKLILVGGEMMVPTAYSIEFWRNFEESNYGLDYLPKEKS